MNINSNDNPTDTEQDLNALFAAAYSGDDKETTRLMTAEGSEPEATTTEDEDTTDEQASSDEDTSTDEQVDAASGDQTTENSDEQAATEESANSELEALRTDLHRYKSDAGRVPFLNRRVQELERQLQDASRTPAPKPETAGDLPPNLKAKVDRLREVDPDMADTLEETYKTIAAEHNKLAAAQLRDIEIRRQSEDNAYATDQYTRLVNVFPEAPQVFASQKWKDWKSRLTPNYRALAESSNADEVAEALRNFKVDAERHMGGYDWATRTTTEVAPPAQQSQRAAVTAASRAQRLSQSTQNKSVAARNDTSDVDLESIFKDAYDAGIESFRVK